MPSDAYYRDLLNDPDVQTPDLQHEETGRGRYEFLITCENCDLRARRGTPGGRDAVMNIHEGQHDDHTTSWERDPLHENGDSDE